MALMGVGGITRNPDGTFQVDYSTPALSQPLNLKCPGDPGCYGGELDPRGGGVSPEDNLRLLYEQAINQKTQDDSGGGTIGTMVAWEDCPDGSTVPVSVGCPGGGTTGVWMIMAALAAAIFLAKR